MQTHPRAGAGSECELVSLRGQALFGNQESNIAVATSAIGSAADRASSCAALRAFFNISNAWGLRPDEEIILLGYPRKRTYSSWKRHPESALLARDTLERISYVLGIYKALQVLLPDPEAADAWIGKPNAAAIFGGGSALERMLSGNVSDLYVARNFLDVLKCGGS